ncbi:MAG: tRNA guanosine(34) transglycosylase Tgt [Rhodobacterales bacterium]|nr:tRNA guanosine(34) transglycosylase Tgt [Rhodobacterales bacterium]
MNSVNFRLNGTDGGARATTFQLPRGEVQTPLYMPVGTQGAVRSVSSLHMADTGTQILLANTYHLSQRPGEDLIAKAGGLHKFMGSELPMLTDSGGFQVFSLDKEVDEKGVTFQYEVDGKRTFLSPERSMEIQEKLGADIAMVFDECLAFGTEKSYAEQSVARTTRWEQRCKDVHKRPDQSLFGIVQGGFWPDLRKRSAQEICDIGFDGYAIGGLSVGEGYEVMCEVLEWTTPHMPVNAPRYLMGVGRPLDLVEAVARGVDMFDCVLQTRHARSGVVYTGRGRLRMSDRRFRNDFYPVDTECTCYTCQNYSRAYLNHLLRVGEVLSATLCSIHNIAWFHQFMARMRQSILEKRFEAFRREVHELYPPGSPGQSNSKPASEAQGGQKSRSKRGRGGKKR